MSEFGSARGPVVRVGAGGERRAAARLLDAFNREYGYPSPGPGFLSERLAELDGDDFATFLAADAEGSPAGVAVVRVRPSIWEAAGEAYIAELYVVAGSRRQGLGSALMEAMLAFARERGCRWVELGTDENDHDAHRLYERFGFTNYVNPAAPTGERERMLFFEREL